MGKVYLILVVVSLILTIAYAETVSVNADSAILYDIDSGRILYAKHESLKRPMASTTKIMTAVMAIELGDMNDVVEVSRRASSLSGSSLGLKCGEKIALRDLIYGLMLRSGNDAAVAIAEHIGGSIRQFADLMTSRAHDVGARDTSFSNPHGLDQHNHYSTARDLAILTSNALKNPFFAEIVRVNRITVKRANGQRTQVLHNINKFLSIYEGAVGVKTGYTSGAGKCLVAAADRDGWRLVAVVLNSPTRYKDCVALLDYGYKTFERHNLVNEQISGHSSVMVTKGKKQKVDVVFDDSFMVPLTAEERAAIKVVAQLPGEVAAPINCGQVLGSIKVTLGKSALGEIPFRATSEVRRKTFSDHLEQLIVELSNNMGMISDD